MHKILIIDDAPDAIRMASRHLLAFGEVMAATDGHEGLAVARQALPDLILLDVQMPDCDGYEVLAGLKSDDRTSEIPVIMVTSDHKPETEARLLDLGAADFIAKPLNPTVLKARVAKEIQLARALREVAEQNLLLEKKVAARTAELVVARDAAEMASRAKSNFMSNISHEMRTPLHQISGLVFLVKKATSEPKQLQHLEGAQRAITHLGTLIEGVLTSVQLESNSVKVEIDALNLDLILSQVVHAASDVEDIARKKGLTLSSNLIGLAPEALYGDARLIGMALSCLVGNALKYTERGGVTVEARVSEAKADTVSVKFSVADTGPGISAELLPRLFQVFEQGDASHTRRYGGTGLGLHLLKQLAQAMGGDAGCESERGVGSHFWFSVTLATRRPAHLADDEWMI